MSRASADLQCVEVRVAGLASSVQDAGRDGYRGDGIGAAGAFDRAAYRLGQCLLGEVATAALEITLTGPTLRFEAATRIALSGAPIEAWLDGDAIAGGQRIAVLAGAVLKLGRVLRGCRSYLAVAGGWQVPLRLGSASTDLRGGFGGLDGRCLRAGDRLHCRRLTHAVAPAHPGRWSLAPAGLPVPARPLPLRLIAHPAADATALAALTAAPWQVGCDSNRQGLRLVGAAHGALAGSGVSEPVLPGTVQWPPAGSPIVLGIDAQTVGGYPVAGWIIDADRDRLAQLPPGQSLRLQVVERALALQLARRRRDRLQRAEAALRARLR